MMIELCYLLANPRVSRRKGNRNENLWPLWLILEHCQLASIVLQPDCNSHTQHLFVLSS